MPRVTLRRCKRFGGGLLFVCIMLVCFRVFLLDTKSLDYNETVMDAKDEVAERHERINALCAQMDVPGKVDMVYTYENVSYCSNHKVASTYWLQIFRFLHGDVVKPVERPSDIPKYDTHLVRLKHGIQKDFYLGNDHETIMETYRFMMTRDPYQRLWSVYVDKFVLFDNWFWTNYGPKIRHAYSTAHKDDPDPVYKEQWSRGKPQCLHITFKEYLYYVVEEGKVNPGRLDDHMRPVHYGCNPCKFKPDFVGKVEKLNAEKTPLLERLGLKDIDEVKTFEDHVKNEFRTISTFGFKLKSSTKPTEKCLSDVNLEERLINGFIINGYLPENTQDQVKNLLPLGEERFTSKMIEIFLESSRTHEEVSQQRKQKMLEAYRNVPLSILKEIEELFQYDFLLFGYEREPSDIFADRSEFEDDNNNMKMNKR